MATSEVAQRAKKVRGQLKAEFPGIKFSVRVHNYSGGDSIRIEWTDGPKSADVKAIAQEFGSVRRCEASGEILGGGNSYVFVERRYSSEAYQAALEVVCQDWGLDVPEFSVSCGSPYLSHEQDVQSVGGGNSSLGELIWQHLADLDLRATEGPAPAAADPIAPSSQLLAGTMNSYNEFMVGTTQPKSRQAEDRNGKLIGGQFEYGGWEFRIEPVNSATKGYKTIGYQLIVGGEYQRVLGYTSHRPNHYFRSLAEARRAAFWYLSGEKATSLELSVLCQIFRKTDQIAWLLETVGGTLFRNQLVDRDLQEWGHQEIAAEALAMLHDLEAGQGPSSEGDRSPMPIPPPPPADEALASSAPDPRLTQRAARFRDMADRLQETIDQKLAPRLENTPKRAREAEAQRHDGYKIQGVQAILRAIADQTDDGTLSHPLSAITNKAQIETLMGFTEENILSGKGGVDGIMAKLKLSPEQMVELLRQLKGIVRGNVVIDHDAEELKRLMAELRYCGIPGYVTTPRVMAEEAIAFLEITNDDFVLDPQGGSGALLNVIRDRHPGARLATLEINGRLREILQLQGFDVLGDDSMKYHPGPSERPTKIAMNPPFEAMADIGHVRHAYDILAPGGRMVAIMSASPFNLARRAAIAFRSWLDEVPIVLHCEKNAPDTFRSSGATVQTYLVVLEKPAALGALPQTLPAVAMLRQLSLSLF